jgi:hypothetical protein
MAGILVDPTLIESMRNQLRVIRDKFLSIEKTHITDLDSHDQEKLRNEIYDCIKSNQIICLYEAVFVQGFHESFKCFKKSLENSKAKNRSSVKISSPRIKELLHAHLFEGIFSKALAYCLDKGYGNEFRIQVITDNIDRSIADQFREKATEILNVHEPYVNHSTGFDTESKELVHGNVTSEIHNADNLIDDLSKVELSIDIEDSELTLCADVIANSLHYHFKNRSSSGDLSDLNVESALDGYCLNQLFYGLWDANYGAWFSDAIFSHPDRTK